MDGKISAVAEIKRIRLITGNQYPEFKYPQKFEKKGREKREKMNGKVRFDCNKRQAALSERFMLERDILATFSLKSPFLHPRSARRALAEVQFRSPVWLYLASNRAPSRVPLLFSRPVASTPAVSIIDQFPFGARARQSDTPVTG